MINKINIVFMVVFGLLAIISLIGVCCGATHQWLTFIVDVLMFIVFFEDYRKHKQTK